MKREWLAVVGVAVMLAVGGCIVDDSVPNRRGLERGALKGAGQDEKTNAEKRALEAPQREMPTGSGKEFPGQSRRDDLADPSVVTLADVTPTTQLSDVPIVPQTTPAAGPLLQGDDRGSWALPADKVMPVPGTSEIIPPSWGQAPALVSYPHRPWAPRAVTYHSGEVKHNPPYWGDVFQRPDFQPDPNKIVGPALQDYAEVFWFYGESVAVPVLMVINPPLAQRTTRHPVDNPIYNSYLPMGALVPAPVPGEIRFVYPFTSTQPSPTITPLIPPALTPATQPAGQP